MPSLKISLNKCYAAFAKAFVIVAFGQPGNGRRDYDMTTGYVNSTTVVIGMAWTIK